MRPIVILLRRRPYAAGSENGRRRRPPSAFVRNYRFDAFLDLSLKKMGRSGLDRHQKMAGGSCFPSPTPRRWVALDPTCLQFQPMFDSRAYGARPRPPGGGVQRKTRTSPCPSRHGSGTGRSFVACRKNRKCAAGFGRGCRFGRYVPSQDDNAGALRAGERSSFCRGLFEKSIGVIDDSARAAPRTG